MILDVYGYMNDIYQIFDDGFQRLARLEEIGFESCFHIVSDLTKIAIYADFKQGVFVMEILEGIFAQIGHLFENYDIPKDESAAMKCTINQGISSLPSVYRIDDSATCEILVDMRFAATKFQFKCFTTWRRLSRSRSSSGVIL